MGKCKLCLVESELRQSHIIPEWLYKDLYDSKNRILSVQGTLGKNKTSYIQKGIRENLLCENCENKLSKWEGYVARKFRKIKDAEVRRTKIPNLGLILIEDSDYSNVKLFQLSILWRASISKDKLFSEVILGKYEEKIRQMLLSESPGSQDFIPCSIFSVKRDSEYKFEGIFPPKKTKVGPSTNYTFYISAWIFNFYVSEIGRPEMWNLITIGSDNILPVGELFGEKARALVNASWITKLFD